MTAEGQVLLWEQYQVTESLPRRTKQVGLWWRPPRHILDILRAAPGHPTSLKALSADLTCEPTCTTSFSGETGLLLRVKKAEEEQKKVEFETDVRVVAGVLVLPRAGVAARRVDLEGRPLRCFAEKVRAGPGSFSFIFIIIISISLYIISGDSSIGSSSSSVGSSNGGGSSDSNSSGSSISGSSCSRSSIGISSGSSGGGGSISSNSSTSGSISKSNSNSSNGGSRNNNGSSGSRCSSIE